MILDLFSHIPSPLTVRKPISDIMRRPNAAISLLALLLPGILAESIIVVCSGKEATQKAKDLVTATGGRIFYEYRIV